MTKTSGIIKRIKKERYVQINNQMAQDENLSFSSIGLITHLLSLPESWVVYKTQLQKRFGRAATDNAFKQLENEGYIVSIKYRDGKFNQYQYFISDEKFTHEEVRKMVEEFKLPILEIKCAFGDIKFEVSEINISRKTVKSTFLQVSEIDSSLSAVENQQQLNKHELNKHELNKHELNKTVKQYESDTVSTVTTSQFKNEIIKLSKEYPNISFEWLSELLQTSVNGFNQGKIKNVMGYVRSATKQFNKRLNALESTENQKTNKLPSYFKTNNKISIEELERLEKQFKSVEKV